MEGVVETAPVDAFQVSLPPAIHTCIHIYTHAHNSNNNNHHHNHKSSIHECEESWDRRKFRKEVKRCVWVCEIRWKASMSLSNQMDIRCYLTMECIISFNYTIRGTRYINACMYVCYCH